MGIADLLNSLKTEIKKCLEGMLLEVNQDTGEYEEDRNLPLELNLLGLREGRNYPDERFWRIVGEEGGKAILGSDAHRPEHVLDPFAEALVREMAARCGVAILDTVELVPPVS